MLPRGFVVLLLICGCPNRQPLRTEHSLTHQRACVTALMSGTLDVATAECSLCLEYGPHDPECLNAMGLIAQQRGRFDDARVDFKRAMSENPEFAEARNNFGVLLMEVDRNLRDAAEMFRSALHIDPGYRDARYNLALCLVRTADALHADAIRTSGGSVDPAVLRREFGPAEQKYEESETQLRRLQRLDPENPKVVALRAWIASQRAQYAPTRELALAQLDEARMLNEQCIALAERPSREALQCEGNLAWMLEQRGLCADAREHYAACLEMDREEPECRRGFERVFRCPG